MFILPVSSYLLLSVLDVLVLTYFSGYVSYGCTELGLTEDADRSAWCVVIVDTAT